MQYFSGAVAAAAFITPSDLSIPSTSDICAKSAQQCCNKCSGLNTLLILPFLSTFHPAILVHKISNHPSIYSSGTPTFPSSLCFSFKLYQSGKILILLHRINTCEKGKKWNATHYDQLIHKRKRKQTKDMGMELSCQ